MATRSIKVILAPNGGIYGKGMFGTIKGSTSAVQAQINRVGSRLRFAKVKGSRDGSDFVATSVKLLRKPPKEVTLVGNLYDGKGTQVSVQRLNGDTFVAKGVGLEAAVAIRRVVDGSGDVLTLIGEKRGAHAFEGYAVRNNHDDWPLVDDAVLGGSSRRR